MAASKGVDKQESSAAAMAQASPASQGPGPTLAGFLEQNPWDPAWTALGSPLDYLWSWDLPVAPSALWPYLIDTSGFNRSLGMGPMVFQEREGKVLGSSGSGISRLEWEEVPWEWDYLHRMGNARIYSRGFARYVRSRYLLSEPSPGHSRLMVYFGWIPRTLLGRIAILPLSMRWLEKRFGERFLQIVDEIRHAPAPPQVQALSEGAQSKLAAVRKQFLDDGWKAEELDPLFERLRVGTDDELHRIRVRAVARFLDRPVREILRAFLQATRLGLFTLSWDVICPHCRGARQELAHLGDVPTRGSCEACHIDFDTTGLNALEVTFHVHPTIRKIEKQLYCAAEPAKRPHILIQEPVEAGQQVVLQTALREGRYRLRLQGTFDYSLLTVTQGAGPSRLEWQSGMKGATFDSGTGPELVLTNAGSERSYFIVELAGEDQDAVRPRDLFCLQEFRDLFSEEAVAADVQLDVGTQAVLLTDIVGSTQHYETVGDSVAFAHVQKHFVKIFEAIGLYRGAVVKTMGDAVMAVFERPVDALRACVMLQERFPAGSDDPPVRVRASLHLGPCLAVNLNSSMDYFGSTVNFCAKLQGLAGAGQIVFTQAFRNDPEVLAELATRSAAVEELEFGLKWHAHASKVYRIEVG